MKLLEFLRSGSGHAIFVRMFSSAVTNQAMLSAANLLVGLVLIRATADEQYGYYVLVINSILLLNSLQGAFLHPPLALRIAREGPAACADLVGGLFNAQTRLTVWAAIAAIVAVVAAHALGRIDLRLAALLCAALVATAAAMYREFFRTVLFVSKQPHAVLTADLLYIGGQIGGVLLAARTGLPATVALLTLAMSAVAGGWLLARALRRSGGIDRAGSTAAWREIAHMGAWSAAGSASHWTFSQGYNYVVVAVLDVSSVSALAATRLLLMPVNLLSTGISPLLMPFAAEWLHKSGPAAMVRRIAAIGAGLSVLSAIYLVVLWLARNWIFEHLMHKHFAHADTLLALWSLTFLVTAFRDQLRAVPATFGRFKVLFFATVATAALALVACWFGLHAFGIAGAPLAVLCGELLSLLFIIVLSVRLAQGAHPAPEAATLTATPGPVHATEPSGT